MQQRKHIGITLAIAVILILLALGFRTPAISVDVSSVERQPLQVSIDEEGKTRVIDRYIVSAPLAAHMPRLELRAGDPVQRGQRLLQLTPQASALPDTRQQAAAQAQIKAARARVKQAQQGLIAAQAEAELANLEYNRIVNLCEIQCASKEEQDQARAKLRSRQALAQSARFAVDVARHQLEAAQTALNYAGHRSPQPSLNIVSPVDGVVLKILHRDAGILMPGTALLEIGDPSRLEIEVELLSADATRIHPGTRVLFKRWGGKSILEGQVDRIEPSAFTKVSALGVEEQRVRVIARLTSEDEQWQGLGDGYRVEASFILWQEDDVLSIPSSSLFKADNHWAVFVLDDGTAKQIQVSLGQRNGLRAQVLSGLSEGQQVLSHPSESIENGVRVIPR